MLGKPLFKVDLLTAALLVMEITGNELFSNQQPGVRGEDHVRKLRLWRHQLDFTSERLQRFAQLLPLREGLLAVRAAPPAHPGIDFVFDPVVVRRAEQQPRHERLLLRPCYRGTQSIRAGTVRCRSPNRGPERSPD